MEKAMVVVRRTQDPENTSFELDFYTLLPGVAWVQVNGEYYDDIAAFDAAKATDFLAAFPDNGAFV